MCCSGWVGFKRSYVIDRVGRAKILCLLTRWVGGSKKGQKYAYVIYESSHTIHISFLWSNGYERQVITQKVRVQFLIAPFLHFVPLISLSHHHPFPPSTYPKVVNKSLGLLEVSNFVGLLTFKTAHKNKVL